MRTRIAGRFVVGHDGGDHVVFRDGEVVYEDDTILFVGHGFAGRVDRTIEAGDAIVSPGFIDLNALADIDHGILDTFQDTELALGLQWSEEYVLYRRHELFSPDDERFQRRYALIQLLLNGITTAMPIAAETYREWCETYEQLGDVAQIAGELGLRMYLGPAYRSGINVVRADGKEQRTVDRRGLIAAGFVLPVTTLDPATWPPEDVLALYRCRRQIELLFTRLEGI